MERYIPSQGDHFYSYSLELLLLLLKYNNIDRQYLSQVYNVLIQQFCTFLNEVIFSPYYLALILLGLDNEWPLMPIQCTEVEHNEFISTDRVSGVAGVMGFRMFSKGLGFLVHIMWFPACSRLLTKYITSLHFVFWSFFAFEVLHFDFVLLSFFLSFLFPPSPSLFLLPPTHSYSCSKFLNNFHCLYDLFSNLEVWLYAKVILLTKQCNSKHRI